MSVFSWQEEYIAYNFGRDLGDQAVGINEKGISDVCENFGSSEKRKVVGFLMISGPDGFIEFLARRLENRFDVKLFEESEAIYLRVGIAKAVGEILPGGDMPNEAELFTGLKLGPDAYFGGIRYIWILREMA